MKNKTLTYLVLSLLCCMSACTSVDLCPEAEHPHITDMRVRLNWGDISKDEIPAEMHIVASRIINTWRTHGIVDTSADPATDNNITLQQSSSDSGTAVTAASSFYLRGGEYNIFVINEQYADTPVQTDETKPTPIISIDNLDNYIHDNRISVKDLYLQISSMGDEKPGIVEGNDLPDFNPDDEYLKEVKSPIFYAVQKNINIQTGQPTVMEFDMQRISQRINIIFNIRTEGNIKRKTSPRPSSNCPELADASISPTPVWTPPAYTGRYIRCNRTNLRKPAKALTDAQSISIPSASSPARPKGISTGRASYKWPCRCPLPSWTPLEHRYWMRTAIPSRTAVTSTAPSILMTS